MQQIHIERLNNALAAMETISKHPAINIEFRRINLSICIYIFNNDMVKETVIDLEGFSREEVPKLDREYFGLNPSEWLDILTCKTIEGFRELVDRFTAVGYGVYGYNREGYNREGYNREGFNRRGFNKNGLNKKGFNRHGYNIEGLDRYGCDLDGYNSSGLDRYGCGRDGYNSFGLDRYGCGRDGYDTEGYDKDGLDKDGLHADGYDEQGFNIYGYDIKGYDHNGYNSMGVNKQGVSIEENEEGGDTLFDENGVYKLYPDKFFYDVVPKHLRDTELG